MEKVEKKLKLLPSEITHTAVPMGVFRWRANPKKNTAFDDILAPEYWDNVKDKFRVVEEKHQGQVVEIYPVDGKYYAELLAIRLSNGQVSVRRLMFVQLDDQKIDLNVDDFEIKFRGRHKWSIIRKDGTVIEELLDTEAIATQKLAEYINTV